MNYDRWVREQLRKLSLSSGFVYTPPSEIGERLRRLRSRMRATDMEALLIVEKMNLYYLSGTTQDGLLYVPLEGKPLLMIRREWERAKVESPLEQVVLFTSTREIPPLIKSCEGHLPKTLGLEWDLLPVRDYLRFQNLLPGSRLVDCSLLLRETRKVKSPFEIRLMEKAAAIGKKVYQQARRLLKEGMTEIEFGGLLEAAAKKHGHEGILRVRSVNYEAYSWHVLSGITGGIVSQSDSPMGGLGLSTAFPVGASRKRMKREEPILVDFGTCYQGYQVDETRMFSIGKMKQKFVDAYRACREIHDAVLARTRPGADCEALYKMTLPLAEKLGYRENYLGPPGLQTRFVGHGIGLELNELPFLAEGRHGVLEQGMTFALEPKIVSPGEAAVGIENTILVTSDGYKILTPLSSEIFVV